MKTHRIIVVLAVVLLLIVLPVISYYYLNEGETVRTQRRVPHFSLLSQTGDSISSVDLEGDVYVADFVYSRCEHTCGELQQTFRILQDTFKNRNDFKLVTYTIDPEHDSLPVLTKWADEYRAIPGKWHFLTGEREPLYDLINGGYFGKVKYVEGENPEFVPDPKLVLIDRQGFIKGYYEAETPEDVEEIIKAVERELKKK